MRNCFFNKRNASAPTNKGVVVDQLVKCVLVAEIAKTTLENKLKPVSIIQFYYSNPKKALFDVSSFYMVVQMVAGAAPLLLRFLFLVSEDSLIQYESYKLMTNNTIVENIGSYKQSICIIIIGFLMLRGTLMMPAAEIHSTLIDLSLEELNKINKGLAAIEMKTIPGTNSTRRAMNIYCLHLGKSINNTNRLINFKLDFLNSVSQALPVIPSDIAELICDYNDDQEDASANSSLTLIPFGQICLPVLK